VVFTTKIEVFGDPGPVVDVASQPVHELRRSAPASLTGVPIGLGGENAS